MANQQVRKSLYENLSVFIKRVKTADSPFGAVYSEGTIVLNEEKDFLFLSTARLNPPDTVTKMLANGNLVPIGGVSLFIGTMYKAVYDTGSKTNPNAVDTARTLLGASGFVDGDDLIEHIHDRVGDKDFKNAHNLNAKADLHGNPNEKFEVKDGENAKEAINMEQFTSVRNMGTAIPTDTSDANMFMKGFWPYITSRWPAYTLEPSQAGWYWIISTKGPDPDGVRQWGVGDYMVYTGVGNGSEIASWQQIPASSYIAEPSTGLKYISEGGNSGWALFNDNRSVKKQIGNSAIDMSFITDPAFNNLVGSEGDHSFTLGENNLTSGDRSITLGGELLRNTEDDTVMVPRLNIGGDQYVPEDKTYEPINTEGNMHHKLLVLDTEDVGKKGVVQVIEDNKPWSEPTTASIFAGGIVTRVDTGTANPSTQIQITGGSAQIVDVWSQATGGKPQAWEIPQRHYVDWPTQIIDLQGDMSTATTAILSVYVEPDSASGPTAGKISISNTKLDNHGRRSYVALAEILYSNSPAAPPTDIIKVTPTGVYSNNITQTFNDLTDFLPERALIKGIELKPVTNPLSLSTWQSRGSIFSAGINRTNDAKNPNVKDILRVGDSSTPLVFKVINSLGQSVTWPPGMPGTGNLDSETVIPFIYENGATGGGTPTAGITTEVPATKAVIQYIYSDLEGTYYVQLGQSLFDGGGRARASLKDDRGDQIVYPGMNHLTFIGQIYVQKEAVDFQDPELAGIENSAGDFSQGADDVRSFINLDDVPTNYTGHGGKRTTVGLSETGLRFEHPYNLKELITQPTHGFVTGDCIYFDNTDSLWKKASSSDPTKYSAAMVELADANKFFAIYSGVLDYGAPHTLTVDTQYYLSPTTDGALVAARPSLTDIGYRDYDVCYVISDTKIFVYPSPFRQESVPLVEKFSRIINQTAHGFAQGEMVYLDTADGDWKKAQADDKDTLMQAYVNQPSTDNFEAVFSGLVTLNAHGYTSDMYLSATTAGAVTATLPTLPGDIIQLCIKPLDSSTFMLIPNEVSTLSENIQNYVTGGSYPLGSIIQYNWALLRVTTAITNAPAKLDYTKAEVISNPGVVFDFDPTSVTGQQNDFLEIHPVNFNETIDFMISVLSFAADDNSQTLSGTLNIAFDKATITVVNNFKTSEASIEKIVCYNSGTAAAPIYNLGAVWAIDKLLEIEVVASSRSNNSSSILNPGAFTPAPPSTITLASIDKLDENEGFFASDGSVGGGGGDTTPVGTIVESTLTEAQFNAATPNNTDWALADGRDVTGTLYATVTGRTTLPDMRGAYMRMAGQNASNAAWKGGALNGYQEDRTKRPVTPFTTNQTGSHTHSITTHYNNTVSGDRINSFSTANFNRVNHTDAAGNHTHTITGGGDIETRPKTYSVNFFIKIDNTNATLTTTKIDPVTVAPVAPAPLAVGQMWLNSDTGDFYILTNNPAIPNVDNFQWVQTNT